MEDVSGITTGQGPARTGDWGFYSYPHGDYEFGTGCEEPNVCGDGFIGIGSNTLYAIGGWLETNTVPAQFDLFIDGDFNNVVDWGEFCIDEENCTDITTILSYEHQFWGFIDTNGLTQFEFREMEGKLGDVKFMFADDFTFAILHEPQNAADFLFPPGVDMIDFAFFFAHYLNSPCNITNDFCDNTDMDFSTKVNLSDLKLFVQLWLQWIPSTYILKKIISLKNLSLARYIYNFLRLLQ